VEDIKCPVCGCELLDEPCEHTVYVATNECGLIYIAEKYRSQYEALAENILKEHGALEEGEPLNSEEFPYEFIDELEERFGNESIVFIREFGIPPCGLEVSAAFVTPSTKS